MLNFTGVLFNMAQREEDMTPLMRRTPGRDGSLMGYSGPTAIAALLFLCILMHPSLLGTSNFSLERTRRLLFSRFMNPTIRGDSNVQ